MYYLYHIPNVKIGCTNNPKRRIKSQGYTDYEILETHDCIDTASKREKELQDEYGYVEAWVKGNVAAVVWHPERMNEPWLPSEINNLLKKQLQYVLH